MHKMANANKKIVEIKPLGAQLDSCREALQRANSTRQSTSKCRVGDAMGAGGGSVDSGIAATVARLGAESGEIRGEKQHRSQWEQQLTVVAGWNVAGSSRNDIQRHSAS